MKQEMNEAPDEALLTLWMDGELDGDELARVEAWARDHPELLAERDAVLAMRGHIRENIPASVEPPYPDFFNQRIMHRIDDELARASADRHSGENGNIWQLFSGKLYRWLAFPAATAVMVLCFYLGTLTKDGSGQPAAQTIALTAAPTIYTPDGDVRAAMFSSEEAGATVIVLEGLEDIPDDLEMLSKAQHSRPSHHGVVMVSSGMVF